jgi:hypothetical protein
MSIVVGLLSNETRTKGKVRALPRDFYLQRCFGRGVFVEGTEDINAVQESLRLKGPQLVFGELQWIVQPWLIELDFRERAGRNSQSFRQGCTRFQYASLCGTDL